MPKQIFSPSQGVRHQVTFILVNKLLSNTKIEQIPGWEGEMEGLLIWYHRNWCVYKHVWGTEKRRGKRTTLNFVVLTRVLITRGPGGDYQGDLQEVFYLVCLKGSATKELKDRLPRQVSLVLSALSKATPKCSYKTKVLFLWRIPQPPWTSHSSV